MNSDNSDNSDKLTPTSGLSDSRYSDNNSPLIGLLVGVVGLPLSEVRTRTNQVVGVPPSFLSLWLENYKASASQRRDARRDELRRSRQQQQVDAAGSSWDVPLAIRRKIRLAGERCDEWNKRHGFLPVGGTSCPPRTPASPRDHVDSQPPRSTPRYSPLCSVGCSDAAGLNSCHPQTSGVDKSTRPSDRLSDGLPPTKSE